MNCLLLKFVNISKIKRRWIKFMNAPRHSNRRSSLSSSKTIFLITLIFICSCLWGVKYLELEKNRDFNFKNGSIEDCLCSGENFCFKGLNEKGKTVNGKRFDCSLYEGLRINGLLDEDASNAQNDYEHLNDTWRPIFVTAISDNHFPEGRKLVKSIDIHYPHSKIVIFDLGVRQSYVDEMRSWCNVEYRKFNFNKYPSHVKDPKTYAFKMAIIEAIQDYKTFFYLDSSIRITSKSMRYFLQGIKSELLLPFSTFTYAQHSVFSTTHKKMYDYLPMPLIVTQIKEIQSTFMFVSESTYTLNILKWWYLCAMTKDCIAPEGSILDCKLEDFYDHSRTYLNCHRFDQAYWNIASLSYLFGEQRGALKLGYVDRNWTVINENIVAQVNQSRDTVMDYYFKLVTINRADKMKKPLRIKCKQ